MQKRHMDEAMEIGAPIVDIGDLFCVMQGTWDKRADKSSCRPEHRNGKYLDAVVNTGVEFFEPYAENLVFIASGNHEEAIRINHETCLIERLCGGLSKNGNHVHHGGYGGWCRFRFRETGSGKARQTVNLHYDHGAGGGGPVTKGVIQTNRRAVYLPDADIVVSGHIHERWEMTLVRDRLSSNGRSFQDYQTHISLPTYKEEYRDGFGGWHVRRGAPPKPIGATWLVFKWDHINNQIRWNVEWAT